jgi:putative ABC transport system permease protein
MKFLKLFFRRNLVNNKLTWLNIAGLVIGMFAFLFIYFYVYTENSYDQFLPDANEIYHLELSVDKSGTNSHYSTTPIPLAEAIYNEVSGVESYATYCSIFETRVLNVGETEFLNPVILYAKPGFLETFHYKAVDGNLNHALEPGKMVITRSAAMKYFGTEQVVGKSVRLLHDKKEPLLVTVEAVMEDMPYNSNVQFEMVGNMDDYLRVVGKWVDSWYIKASQSYIKLKQGANFASVQQQITNLANKYMNSENTETRGLSTVYVENISLKHFSKNYTLQHPTERFVSKISLQILLLVGLITLVISWLNYANLLIFQNTKHFREIGIRKINGSSKGKLIWMLMKESLLLSAIPVFLSIALFFLVAPALYDVFQFHSMTNIRINRGQFWGINLGLLFAGSALSSIFPIIRLTRFQPIEMILNKSGSASGQHKNGSLLTVQFVLSIVLICGILGINVQMNFLDKQDLGFTKDNIMVLSPPITPDILTYNQKMDLFKKEAGQIPGVVASMASSSIPGQQLTTEHFGLKNREETINKYMGLSTDGDYFDVVDAKFLAGRNFSKIPDLCRNEIIINEALMHKLGISSPAEAINQPTNFGDAVIVGVVSDYSHTSLHDNVKPTLFKFGLDRLIWFMVKFNNRTDQQQIATLKSKWEKVFPDSPFEFTFLDEGYNRQYIEDKQLSKVVMLFSFLSVFITVLGLIGSCLNITYMRTKEIGVRKVNGARVSEIIIMLNKGYVKWVAIAFVIATPIAYYAMHKWLENFAYKTSLSWWIFALAGLLALGIALLTVSWQSWRAATRNPVEALRYE